jgi:hypothetical protein
MPVQVTLSPLNALKNSMKILAGMAEGTGSAPRITPYLKNPCLTSSHIIFPKWRLNPSTFLIFKAFDRHAMKVLSDFVLKLVPTDLILRP